jgi:hypothetical protein
MHYSVVLDALLSVESAYKIRALRLFSVQVTSHSSEPLPLRVAVKNYLHYNHLADLRVRPADFLRDGRALSEK